jgi:hypothetical protein
MVEGDALTEVEQPEESLPFEAGQACESLPEFPLSRRAIVSTADERSFLVVSVGDASSCDEPSVVNPSTELSAAPASCAMLASSSPSIVTASIVTASIVPASIVPASIVTASIVTASIVTASPAGVVDAQPGGKPLEEIAVTSVSACMSAPPNQLSKPVSQSKT